MAIWGKLSGPVHLDLGADITSKAQIRSKVWDFLEKNDIANFPRPVHNRIPNFKGSGTAGLSVAQLPEFQRAQIIKVNPDKAQEEVRYQALDHRKTLLVPTPRLTHGLFNKLVHPGEANKELLRKLSSRQGLAENSVPVSLETRLKIDLVVLGSVAVDRLGHRIGKGEGFADLEFAVAASHHEAVDQDTVVVSTVHDCQVFDSLPEEIFAPHDVPVDIIVTPTQVIRVSNKLTKPQNIIWSMITREKFRQIGLLKEIRFKEKNLGIDVGLKEEVDKKKNSLDKPIKIGGYVGTNVSNECGDDGKAFAIVGDDKMEKVVDKNVRTKSKPRGMKLDPGIAKIKDEENTTGKIKDDDAQRGNKVNKNESRTEKSEKFDQSDRSKSYRYDRSKMFGVFIGQMAKATRVRDLKKALLAKQVSPTELVWKGHKGIAFVYFEEGGEEILTKLAGLTVKEKVVNIEQVRVMEKESKPMKVKNNNVVNEIKEVSEAEKSNEDKTIKKVDDVNRKSNSETGKVERYSSKRGKRKANGKSQVVVEGGDHEEHSVKDDNIEIESNEVNKTMEVSQNVPKTDELDKVEDIKSESEQKSDNEIVLDANKCDNLLKINEVEKNDIENEIILEDSSEIVSVPKIETIDPIDTSSEHFIEPAAMFTSNENISELAPTGDVPKTESLLEKYMYQDAKNVLECSASFDELQVNTTDDSTIELINENQIEPIDKNSLPNEKINSPMMDESSSEKISESPEPKPNNSIKNEESVKCNTLGSNKIQNLAKKSKSEENPKSVIEIFKPKAEEKLKSETLIEKEKEKKEAKIKVEEIAKLVVEKKTESEPIPPEPKPEMKEKSKSVKVQRNDEVRQSTMEKRVEQKPKLSEASKEKHASKSKDDTAMSGAEKPKEKREKSKVRLDTKSKTEEKSKLVTEVSKEKDGDKSHQEDKRKIDGKSKALEKDEIPHPSVKKVASKESSSSKSSSEASKKSSKEVSSHNAGSTASSSPVNNPESPKPPIDSEKDPEKCLIS